MKRLFAVFCLISLLFPVAFALSPADVDNVHLRDRTRFVSDMAGVMSPGARVQADSLLASMWRLSSAEPVVVILPGLDGGEINDFATALFSEWGIGKKDKDNGVLVLIAVDDRKMVIRTGYGAEGVLPDVIASNIIRNDMAPHFRRGDYDGGVLAALASMNTVLTSPEAREELMSRYANDAGAGSGGVDVFRMYLVFCTLVGVGLLVLVPVVYFSSRRQPTAKAYGQLQSLKLPALVATVLTLGFPLPAYLLLIVLMRHVRLHKRLCPNCSTRMVRVDEDNDNSYLTQSQDAEERLDSVDYDVWLCPECSETDIIPYVNPARNYTVCPRCNARACTLVNRRTVMAPTTMREGRGVEEYACLNCRSRWQKPYTIAKLAAPPIIIGGGGGFGSGGGGFSGGSFGGGMTGGGGASGGW